MQFIIDNTAVLADSILIDIQSTPVWIIHHLFFISNSSIEHLASDMSDLTEMSLGRELQLDNRLMTSIVCLPGGIACGHLADSLYFPKWKQSQILCEVITLSTCETVEVTLVRSYFAQPYFFVPFWHSRIPYRICMLYFQLQLMHGQFVYTSRCFFN